MAFAEVAGQILIRREQRNAERARRPGLNDTRGVLRNVLWNAPNDETQGAVRRYSAPEPGRGTSWLPRAANDSALFSLKSSFRWSSQSHQLKFDARVVMWAVIAAHTRDHRSDLGLRRWSLVGRLDLRNSLSWR